MEAKKEAGLEGVEGGAELGEATLVIRYKDGTEKRVQGKVTRQLVPVQARSK